MEPVPNTAQLLRAIVATPAAKGVVLVVLLCCVGIGAGVMWVVDQARSGSCEVNHHPDLSIEELIAVKKRFMAYRKAPQTGMRLTGSELSMLIEDRTATPLFLEIEGQSFYAEIAVGSDGSRCWPVQVTGEVSIEDSKAFILPASLTVGALELTPVVEKLRIELLPEHMPSARSANLLQKTRAAAVVDGALQVELYDPQASLFSND